MKAIETYYNDHKFRSRLEARWAVFFDAIGLKWVYEMEGYILGNGIHYLPDFFFPELQCFGEVKPDNDIPDNELTKIIEFAKEKRILLLIGLPSQEPMKILSPDEIESSYEMLFYNDIMFDDQLQKSIRYWRFWYTSKGSNDHRFSFFDAVKKAKQARFEFNEQC